MSIKKDEKADFIEKIADLENVDIRCIRTYTL